MFRAAAPLLRAALGEAAKILERQIDRFEYEEALKTVRALATEGQNGVATPGETRPNGS